LPEKLRQRRLAGYDHASSDPQVLLCVQRLVTRFHMLQEAQRLEDLSYMGTWKTLEEEEAEERQRLLNE